MSRLFTTSGTRATVGHPLNRIAQTQPVVKTFASDAQKIRAFCKHYGRVAKLRLIGGFYSDAVSRSPAALLDASSARFFAPRRSPRESASRKAFFALAASLPGKPRHARSNWPAQLSTDPKFGDFLELPEKSSAVFQQGLPVRLVRPLASGMSPRSWVENGSFLSVRTPIRLTLATAPLS